MIHSFILALSPSLISMEDDEFNISSINKILPLLAASLKSYDYS